MRERPKLAETEGIKTIFLILINVSTFKRNRFPADPQLWASSFIALTYLATNLCKFEHRY